MKTILLSLALFSLTLTSCVRYQYLSVESTLEESPDGFITTNDSISIAYGFTETGKLEIEIHNHSDQMIYVDWNKSALIREGQSFALANDQSALEARTSSIDLLNNGFETGTASGTITHPTTTNFIPVGSYIHYLTRPINFEHYDLKRSSGVEKRNVQSYQIKTLEIDPIEAERFETLLFISDESDANRSIYKHEFWVAKVTETQFNDRHLDRHQVKISQQTGAGKVLGVVGGAALLTVLVAADLEED